MYYNDNSTGSFESLCQEQTSNVFISRVRAYHGIARSLALELERISRKCFIDVDDGSIDKNLHHIQKGLDKQFRGKKKKSRRPCALGTVCISFLVDDLSSPTKLCNVTAREHLLLQSKRIVLNMHIFFLPLTIQ